MFHKTYWSEANNYDSKHLQINRPDLNHCKELVTFLLLVLPVIFLPCQKKNISMQLLNVHCKCQEIVNILVIPAQTSDFFCGVITLFCGKLQIQANKRKYDWFLDLVNKYLKQELTLSFWNSSWQFLFYFPISAFYAKCFSNIFGNFCGHDNFLFWGLFVFCLKRFFCAVFFLQTILQLCSFIDLYKVK